MSTPYSIPAPPNGKLHPRTSLRENTRLPVSYFLSATSCQLLTVSYSLFARTSLTRRINQSPAIHAPYPANRATLQTLQQLLRSRPLQPLRRSKLYLRTPRTKRRRENHPHPLLARLPETLQRFSLHPRSRLPPPKPSRPTTSQLPTRRTKTLSSHARCRLHRVLYIHPPKR